MNYIVGCLKKWCEPFSIRDDRVINLLFELIENFIVQNRMTCEREMKRHFKSCKNKSQYRRKNEIETFQVTYINETILSAKNQTFLIFERIFMLKMIFIKRINSECPENVTQKSSEKMTVVKLTG